MSRGPLKNDRLLRVGTASCQLVKDWREGADIQTKSGLNFQQLILRIGRDRWELAKHHRRDARKMLRLTSPPFRSAISRLYYSMYHALRAACFVYYEGDDHEAHSKLPSKVPSDFVNGDVLGNALKNARKLRNEADYDPYPISLTYWHRECEQLAVESDEFLAKVKSYLKKRGCDVK